MNQIFKNVRISFRALSNGFQNSNVKPSRVVIENTDLLINNLKNAPSVPHVLDLIKTNNNIMNSKHTLQALRTIFMLQKHGRSRLSTSQILKHPDFEKICNQLKYHAGAIELNETIEALKVMSFVGVSSDSTIYQILLQLLKHDVNQMTLQQIIFTDFLLSKATSSPLVDALKIALPIVYDVQLPIKLDQTNLTSLAEHLHYVSRRDVISEQSVKRIVNSLMKVKVFDQRSATSIMWSLCDMPPKAEFEPLLHKAMKSLFIAGYSVPYHDLETIISKLIKKYKPSAPNYYNADFFDYCANIVISQDLGFETAVHLLRKLLRVYHLNTNLLDYISKKCSENSELIENGDPILTYNVIRGCALTDFRPKYYDKIKEAFLNIKNFDNFVGKSLHLPALQAALSVLDIYVPAIVKKVLNEEYLMDIFKKKYFPDFENVLLITQAIKTFKPELSNYLPTEEFIRMVKSNIKPVTDYPLEGSLLHVFGSEKFVKTPALTRMLHHIDHLILLKEGGFASALNTKDLYVEDLVYESPSQVVLVMALNSVCYTNNKHLLGSTSLKLQTLEARGYSVVPIPIALWKSLPEFERLPYIMEAIKSKTNYFTKAYDVS
ncbi:fast leu-rich domain-containing [Holotrichia oblita]|uniref:Fast leu-rich domain-containing n=1 Tax=Holotrichia oblita TaxID=644536 RepID=A0ACB9TP32_HOLOL|nr:fast leu-rich domain-containing [Holotrichia oblita]